jgi:DNA polymerase-3 subunit delta
MNFSDFQNLLQKKKFLLNYFVYGPDGYLVSQARKKLVQAMEARAGAEVQRITIDLDQGSMDEVLNLALNLPMFASCQIIIIRGLEKFKDSHLTRLASYFKNPSPFTTLIFVGGEMDRRKKIYQMLLDSTMAVELDAPKEQELRAWATAKMKAAGCKMDPDAMDFLLEMLGSDSGRLSQEVEKLILLAGEERQISLGRVSESVGFSREHTVFEFLNSVAAQENKKALRLLEEMISDPGEVPGVLALLARQLRQFLQVRELTGRVPPAEIAKIIGVPIGIIGRLQQQARQFPQKTLDTALFRLGVVDDMTKRSAPDTAVFMEMLVHELTR